MNDVQTVQPGQPRFGLRRLTPAIGAEAIGVDLAAPLDDALFGEIQRAWHERCVLVFRRQWLDDLQQVAFAERFGELASTLKAYEGGKIHPALMYVTNEKKDGKYVGALPDGEMFFHSDMCYLERPLSAAMLFAIAVPPDGGNTLFASMYAAYDALPPELKHRLEGRLAVNSYEPGYGTSNVQMRIKASSSPTAHSFAHPIVRTHPATGRKALYVNRLMTECIVGMPRAESDALLLWLFDHQEQPQFQYEHRWEVGDAVIWDNRCTLHARRDFPATHLRKLRRVAVKGERPV
ncbi:MAG TPA: TauD/TfdA family dioxygenase [Myxococcaceae bacterium]|nr:TauD/TfdA family dioxygenase [Myxococcaceae bacterium]